MIAFDNNYYIKPGADPDADVYVQLRKEWGTPLFLTLREWRNYKQFGYDTNTKTSPSKSEVSAVYYNNTDTIKSIDIGTNRINIYGNPITKRIISFEPFEGMIVLEGEPRL